MNFPLLLSAALDNPPDPRKPRVLVTPGVDVPVALAEALRDRAVIVTPPDVAHFDAAHAIAVAGRDMLIIVGEEGIQRSADLIAAEGRRLERAVQGMSAAGAIRGLLEEDAGPTAAPDPLDHWSDPFLDLVDKLPKFDPRDFASPRTDRAAKRDRTGRVGRRDYATRSTFR